MPVSSRKCRACERERRRRSARGGYQIHTCRLVAPPSLRSAKPSAGGGTGGGWLGEASWRRGRCSGWARAANDIALSRRRSASGKHPPPRSGFARVGPPRHSALPSGGREEVTRRHVPSLARCAASARWRCQKRRISRMRPLTWTAKTSGYSCRQGGPGPPRQRSASRQARLRHSTGTTRRSESCCIRSSMSARPSQERNRNSAVACRLQGGGGRASSFSRVPSARGMGGKTIEGCAERNGPDLF